MHGLPYRVCKPSRLSWFVIGRALGLRPGCAPQWPARDLESLAERRLAEALGRADVRVHPQQQFRNRYGPGFEYCADFAYYDAAGGIQIDIEVDGAFKDNDLARQGRMVRRDAWFTSRGWHVLRFHAADCYSDPDACAASIQRYAAAPNEGGSYGSVAFERPGHLWGVAALGLLALWLSGAFEGRFSTGSPPTGSATPAIPVAVTAVPMTVPEDLGNASNCQFVRGFAVFVAELGREIVGNCLQHEHRGPGSGNVEQPTTGGRLVWLRDRNTVAFTNGWSTWYGCTTGIIMRPREAPYPC